MAFQQLKQSLDSLWFFHNALSSPLPTTDPIGLVESEEVKSNPILITQSSNIIDHNGDSSSKATLSSQEEEMESPTAAEKQSNGGGGMVGEIVFESKPESPLERRKRMARRSRSKRKILMELDLCFHDLNILSPRSYGGGGGGGVEGGSFGRSYGILLSQREDRGEIPSLNDSLAMKRHLKSWAHAVACAVK